MKWFHSLGKTLVLQSEVVVVSYNLFNFYHDPGPTSDDNFIAKVQRREIVMLGDVTFHKSQRSDETVFIR